MTLPIRRLLAGFEAAIATGDDPVEVPRHLLHRLVRLAGRAEKLSEALRGDPGRDVLLAVVRPGADPTKAKWNWARMGRALLASTGPFEKGECRVCGCTENTACNRTCRGEGVGACSWIAETGDTLCSNPDCVEAAIAIGYAKPPPCKHEGRVLTARTGDGLEVRRCADCSEVLYMDPIPWDDEAVEETSAGVVGTVGTTIEGPILDGDGTGFRVTGSSGDCYGSGCDEFPIPDRGRSR